MSERLMKNFPFEFDGETYWRSRSCTTVGFVFCKNEDGEWCVLVNQRGPGAPTCRGMWNVPCGYIGFIEECGDVDGEHAIVREIFEETGVKLRPEQFTFDSVTFSKNGEQNINLRYICILNGNKCINDYPLTNEYNEPEETSAIEWLPLSKLNTKEWAFGHKHIIPQIATKLGLLLPNSYD